MDAGLLARWKAAMLSGAYPKVRDLARTDAGFNSIGVLLDVIDPTKWARTPKHGIWRWDGHLGLPAPLRDRVGLSDPECVALFNFDQQCGTFAEVAARLYELVGDVEPPPPVKQSEPTAKPKPRRGRPRKTATPPMFGPPKGGIDLDERDAIGH